VTRRVAVVTGARAEYGMLTPVLRAIERGPTLELALIVTGLHLSRALGHTVDEIERDGFPIAARVDMLPASDQPLSAATALGRGVIGLAEVLERESPDLLLVLGDRPEPLAAALAATYLGVPVAHIHGGEISGGSVDDHVRNAITKLAHLHLVASAGAAARVFELAEAKSRVHVVGSPSVDAMRAAHHPSRPALAERLGLDEAARWIVVAHHPETLAGEDGGRQMEAIVDALATTDTQPVIVYPNADPGAAAILAVIGEVPRRLPRARVFPSLPFLDYLALLRHAAAMVGNSSSGLREAPSFGLPFVCVGDRQAGRERGDNVLDVRAERAAIARALDTALDDAGFRHRVAHASSPFGDGRAGERVAGLLASVELGPRLLRKSLGAGPDS